MLKLFFWVIGAAFALIAGGLAWLGLAPEPEPVPAPEAQVAKGLQILADARWAAPAGWAWAEFALPDGTKLRYGSAAPASPAPNPTLPTKGPKPSEAIAAPPPPPQPVFVFVPGFTGLIEQHFEMFQRLTAQGVRVYGVELRGQGGSSRPLPGPDGQQKSYLGDFKQYADDLAAFINDVVRPAAGENVVVLGGLSLGGHAVLRTALETPEIADGYAPISPAIGIFTKPLSEPQALLLTSTLTNLGAGSHYTVGSGPRSWPPERLDGLGSCGSDPARAAALNAWYVTSPDVLVGGATNAWLAAFVRSGKVLQDEARLAQITRPVMMIIPQRDTVVKAEVSARSCAQIEGCKPVLLQEAHHCPFQDPDTEFNAAYAALSNFIQERAAAAIPARLPAP
jgi:lysophospholipase